MDPATTPSSSTSGSSTSRKRSAPATSTDDKGKESKRNNASSSSSSETAAKRPAPIPSTNPNSSSSSSSSTYPVAPLPPKSHEITVLLPMDAVGLIIGKGGQTLKRLMEEVSNNTCSIRVQPYQEITTGCTQRGITIRGPFEGVENVERDIMELLRFRRQKAADAKAEEESSREGGREGGEEDQKPRKTLRWLIPAELSGLLIGKKGIGREEIQQESGAYLKLAHEEELPPGSTDKLLYIEGASVAAIEQARLMVNAKVGGRAMDNTEGDFVFVNIRAIGFLLGKGGADLKKMCEASGARLQVAGAAELETGSIEIKVRIMGEVSQVAAGKTMLLDRMAEWRKSHPPKDFSSDLDGRESSLKLAVPAAAISALIGKGGAGVKEINAKSGASIKFLSGEPSHDAMVDWRPILVTGCIRNIFKAQRILYDKLASLPPSQRQPARPKLPSSTPSSLPPSTAYPGVGLLDAARGNAPHPHASLLQPSFRSGPGGGAGGLYG